MKNIRKVFQIFFLHIDTLLNVFKPLFTQIIKITLRELYTRFSDYW